MDDETTRDDPYHLASASYGNQGEDIPHSNSDGDDRRRSTGLPLSSPTPQPFAERKWNRYRQDYNDQYLEVFRQIWESSTGEDLAPNYQPTQLGAVYWGSSEKARLYEALDSKGRHDVKAIAQIVRTKSETEVVAYLNVLRQRKPIDSFLRPEPRTSPILTSLRPLKLGLIVNKSSTRQLQHFLHSRIISTLLQAIATMESGSSTKRLLQNLTRVLINPSFLMTYPKTTPKNRNPLVTALGFFTSQRFWNSARDFT